PPVKDNLHNITADSASRYEPFELTAVQQAYLIGRSSGFMLGTVAPHGYVEIESDVLDPERLSIALNRLIARHDMLRAVATADALQRVLPQVDELFVRVDDLRALQPADQEERLLQARERLSHQVFYPERWPLFEICA